MNKTVFILSAMFFFGCSSAMGQDDMYFTPKKSTKNNADTWQYKPTTGSYAYEGSHRDVDEYNRRGHLSSGYENIDLDTLYNDVIEFSVADSSYLADAQHVRSYDDYVYDQEDDYACSRQMSRYDGFYWHDPWYYGWSSPYWYASPYWYSRWWWYDPWYDPWYYGWHRPWGWYHPWHWHVPYYRTYAGVTGTTNHGNPYRHNANGKSNFRGYRGNTAGESNNVKYNHRNNANGDSYSSRFRGNRRDNTTPSNTTYRPSYNNNSSFGNNRSGGSFRGGGSFGGSRGTGGGGGFRGRR